MGNFELLRKQFSTYLEECISTSDISEFERKCINDCPNSTDRKTAIDQALRDTLLIVIDKSYKTGKVNLLESYVTITIELCRNELATLTMPVMMLSDIFDTITLDKCEILFTYVEDNMSVWKEELFFTACKNNLLRMCNDLLRKLSRSQQTVFCGRILLFLAKFFPFSEKSGLNIVSEFNLDNCTEFGHENNDDNDHNIISKIDNNNDANNHDNDNDVNNKMQIDYNLYRKFWTLQDFFRNPNQCYTKMQWKIFSMHASSVLSAFSSFKLDEQRSCTTIDNKNNSDMDTSEPKEAHYFPKYLTNQKLLELQLSDSNFRRCVLLQFLILFQYLNSTVKFKAETHELKNEQAEWVTTTTEQIYTLINETPPDGQLFCETVKNILKREEHWNAWKNDGCPPFKRPAKEPSSDSDEPKKIKKIKRRIGDVIRDAQSTGKFNMGNPELTKLWNLCPNNLEACKSKERDFLPSLETYFEEAIEQLDPLAMVEEEYKKVNDGSFGWRALRLLARRSPHFFVHGNNPINKLPEYLEIMIKKIAKERPQLQFDIVNKNESSEETQVESNEQDFNEDVLKQDTEQVDVETIDSKIRKINPVSSDIIDKLSEVLKNDWQKLASKLGYARDEIKFFESKPTQYDQCQSMLKIWSEADDDASIENLLYILEGLNLTEAAALLQS